MPKKKKIETDKEQSERFRKAVQERVDAGELDPIEAERKLDSGIRTIADKVLPGNRD